jgi:hypothetical protein
VFVRNQQRSEKTDSLERKIKGQRTTRKGKQSRHENKGSAYGHSTCGANLPMSWRLLPNMVPMGPRDCLHTPSIPKTNTYGTKVLLMRIQHTVKNRRRWPKMAPMGPRQFFFGATRHSDAGTACVSSLGQHDILLLEMSVRLFVSGATRQSASAWAGGPGPT